jgi:hypothetical protein
LLKRNWRRVNVARRIAGKPASFAVETFLLSSAGVGTIVLPTPLIGPLATMVLPTAKPAAKILPARVAGMREEAYPAVTAPYRAVPQIRTIPQDGVQRPLILTNKRKDPIVLVPILAKREKFRDGYSKTTRFSVTMLIGFCISSSYPLDAKASRGTARISYA